MARLLLCLALAGCGFSPRAAGTDATTHDSAADSARSDADVDASPDDDAAVDAALDAAPASLCNGAPRIDDEFTGGGTCEPWGDDYASMFTTVTEFQGALRITPTATNQSGGCTEPQLQPWGDNGVIVEVSLVLAGNGNYAVFQLLGLDRSMGVVNNAIVYSNGDGSAVFELAVYSPAAMRWWRMRPSGNDVVAEYSPDGMTWVQLGTTPTLDADIRVNLIAGTEPGASPGGTAAFDRLVVCQ